MMDSIAAPPTGRLSSIILNYRSIVDASSALSSRHEPTPDTSAHARRDGGRHFVCTRGSGTVGNRPRTIEGPRRHELHGNRAKTAAADAEIHLFPALSGSARVGIDRQRTPRRGPHLLRARRATGGALSRTAGINPGSVQKGAGFARQAAGVIITPDAPTRPRGQVLQAIDPPGAMLASLNRQPDGPVEFPSHRG
jgi:hypothetical protein